ncbi:cyclopropane-fatty-acyl-phospholipid synthase [Psychromonas ingrahamii 37]|uniref:Cyclopropane-fatty-acyl-phospholipid synthase n=1 Tax=Psychromonas ingrahamii (strain DSM 17664 / CCUG 51855 / 37) TaxID=357804 RepID=A1STM7_PSYIN|nr:cyclopropane-fatty-acyl-phospholipid synthase family protein [Psychromonas ingrahamii]ABM02842.1 cyclopropane-fatty-acyl-phospholipid synthase [Psychromonas ingrahamii 37]
MAVNTTKLNTDIEAMAYIDQFAKKVLVSILGKMQQACLILVDQQQEIILGDPNASLKGKIVIKNSKTYRKILLGGSVAAGESYIQGWWSSPDLTKVIQVLGREQGVQDEIEKRLAKVMAIPTWIYHKARKNTRSGSKKNILAHYDLGNDLYEQFLDKEMLYSSAIYPTSDASLEEAQLHKLKTICDRLALKKGETLLEIGTGWGALAIYAAQHYGVKVTTTTISEEQFLYTQARVKSLGLEGSITLLKSDYRDLTGQYDKLVSIEMIEAVGHEYLASFFEICNNHLKPHGKMLIQAITIADQRYDQYRSSVDFIQRYIFPGGCLPSISVMANNINNKTDMVITSLHDIGMDYAQTLNHWREQFEISLLEIKKLGYNDDFIRLWRFYFCYCEGAFLERNISAVHLIAAKPAFRA